MNLKPCVEWPLALICLIALGAGAALPLSFAPYDWWWVAFLSPALLYLCLNQRSAKHAFWIGQSYGFGLWCVGSFWLYTSIHDYGDTATPIALLMIAFVGTVMGLFTAIQALLYRKYITDGPLTFAAFWTVAEWCKTWVFTGFPWLFVGYGMTERLLDSYAPVAGVFAVSFVVVLIGAAGVEILRGKRYWLIPTAALLAAAYGLQQIEWTTPKKADALSVSLVQGNIPQDLKWLTEYRQRTLEIYAELSAPEWGRDLVVWPESSIPVFQTEATPFINQMHQMALEKNTAWVTGIPWQDVEAYNAAQDDYPPFYNAIMAAGAQGYGLYKKQRLVPFGEYIPFEGALKWVLPNLKRNMEVASFSAGRDDQAPLEIKGHRLAAAICYEVAYPNITRNNARGSDFLVTLSNDAWFGTSDGPLQHLQMVQMRSRETGRWFIRATNTGVSAFIDHRGHIVSRSAQFHKTVLRGELPAMQGETPYMRFGDWPILLWCALFLGIGGYLRHKNDSIVPLRSRY